MLSTQSIDPNQRPPNRFSPLRWLVALWHWVLPPTQAHSDRESDAKRQWRAITVISLFLGVVVGALLYARPMRKSYKEWRAKGYVEEAQRLVEGKDFNNAFIKAQDAVKLDPEYAPGVRLNAQLLTAGGRSEALFYWGALEKQGAATVDDKKGKVRALLRIGRPREARDLLLELLQEVPNDIELAALAEDVMGRQEASNAVLSMLKKHVTDNPDDRESELRLAKAQLLSHIADEIKEGRAGLWKVAEGSDRVALEAMHLLAQLADLDKAERQRLGKLLDGHSEAVGEDHCQALSLRLSLDPSQRDHLVTETGERWFKNKTGRDLLPFIRWLVLNGEPRKILALLKIEEIKAHAEDREVMLNYLNALSMLSRFDELSKLVNDETLPLSRGERTYYRAHLAASIIFSRPDNMNKLVAGAKPCELLSVKESDDLKQKFYATVAALVNEGRWELLLAVGEHLSVGIKGFYDIAEDAFRAVANSGNGTYERRAVEGWLSSSRRAGSTENLLSAARRGVLRWPDDSKFVEELMYCEFLQGARVESDLPKAALLLQTSPRDSPRKLIAALGYLRLGDIENAIASCQEIKLDEVNEGQMAVFAAIFLAGGPALAADGDLNRFRAQLEAIVKPISPNASLLPEEAAMLERARLEITRLSSGAQARR